MANIDNVKDDVVELYEYDGFVEDMEDMIITTTASPYLSVVFALASVILGIVIKKKEKKTAKQPVEV